MKRKSLMLVIVFFWLFTGIAFANPFLVCDPQTGVDNYKVEISGPMNVTVDVLPDTTGTFGFKLDISPLGLVNGSYTVRVSASNMWGTSSWSTAYPFDKDLPGEPQGIRLYSE
jgi:hypothetical protein